MSWDTSKRRGSTRAGRKVRERVLARNGGLCVLCNERPATVCGHVQQVAHGSPERYEDVPEHLLRGECDRCNRKLSAKQGVEARLGKRKRDPEPHPGLM